MLFEKSCGLIDISGLKYDLLTEEHPVSSLPNAMAEGRFLQSQARAQSTEPLPELAAHVDIPGIAGEILEPNGIRAPAVTEIRAGG